LYGQFEWRTLAKTVAELVGRLVYELGVLPKGIEQVWLDTGNKKVFEYIKCNIEQFVKSDGDICTHDLQHYDLDQINAGKLLFRMYQETGDERYRQASHLLMRQFKTQPRTSEGGREAFGTKRFIPTRCGLMAFIWVLHFSPNMQR
jgi:unsaturated rhamnogalacturonyl hydrolase